MPIFDDRRAKKVHPFAFQEIRLVTQNIRWAWRPAGRQCVGKVGRAAITFRTE
jgi:hypothetical protein